MPFLIQSVHWFKCDVDCLLPLVGQTKNQLKIATTNDTCFWYAVNQSKATVAMMVAVPTEWRLVALTLRWCAQAGNKRQASRTCIHLCKRCRASDRTQCRFRLLLFICTHCTMLHLSTIDHLCKQHNKPTHIHIATLMLNCALLGYCYIKNAFVRQDKKWIIKQNDA